MKVVIFSRLLCVSFLVFFLSICTYEIVFHVSFVSAGQQKLDSNANELVTYRALRGKIWNH